MSWNTSLGYQRANIRRSYWEVETRTESTINHFFVNRVAVILRRKQCSNRLFDRRKVTLSPARWRLLWTRSGMCDVRNRTRGRAGGCKKPSNLPSCPSNFQTLSFKMFLNFLEILNIIIPKIKTFLKRTLTYRNYLGFCRKSGKIRKNLEMFDEK